MFWKSFEEFSSSLSIETSILWNRQIGVIFLISSAMIGTGYQMIPYEAQQIGLVTALLMIIISGIVSMYSSFLIFRVNQKINIRLQQYEAISLSELVENILGKTQGIISSIVVFIITIFQKVSEMILQNFDQQINNSQAIVIIIKLIVAFAGIMFSFVQRKYLEILALIGLIVPLTIIIFYICFLNDLMNETNYKEIQYFKFYNEDGSFNQRIFCSGGKFLYIFNIQYFFLGHLKFLRHKGQNLQAKALLRSFYIPLFVSITICWIGYLSYGQDVPRILLQRQNFLILKSFQVFLVILRFELFFNVTVNCAMLLKYNIDVLCQLFQNEHEKNIINMHFFKEPTDNNLQYLKKSKRILIYIFSLIVPQILIFFIESKNYIQIVNIVVSIFSIYYCVLIPVWLNINQRKKLKIKKQDFVLTLILLMSVIDSIKCLIKHSNQF